MSVSRANLIGGPAKVTWNGVTLHSREDIVPRFRRTWGDVPSSLHGVVDKAEEDRIIEIPMRLFGAYENLSVLFPTSVLAPSYVGTRIYGTSDLPLVIHSVNQDRHTYHNAQLTRLADLFLGVSENIFAADVVFTALIKNNGNPEDAAAYVTLDTAAYSDTTFAKTNYKQQRYSAAWGAIDGFAAFQAKEGWRFNWQLGLSPEVVDGVGTVDMVYEGLIAQAACIPLEPTAAQVLTAARYQNHATNALGRLLSASSADLVITGSGVSVTLKNAGIIEHGYAFGTRPLRNGNVVWESTVGFTAGAPAARAVIA